jgi:hypothetical protein
MDYLEQPLKLIFHELLGPILTAIQGSVAAIALPVTLCEEFFDSLQWYVIGEINEDA